jgi:hypothetical protein
VWPWTRQSSKTGRRDVIIHYHIFKNAGTTVTFVLERNFGSAFASFESKHFNAVLTNEALISFLERHPKIKAVSSHGLWPPKPKHDRFVFHDILFLRHPLARLSSLYDFYRRNEVTDDPLTTEAKKRNTAEFMRLLISDYPQYVRNVQVHYLSARSRKNTQSDLQCAVSVACEATVLGVAELFDLGAVLAEHSLTPVFQRFHFGYVAQNVSSIGPRELSVHLAQFRDACGNDVYEQLLQSNSLDLELLEFARQEVCRRFELIPNHEKKLEQFLLWRSILHPSAVRGVLASNHPNGFVHYANLGTNG